MKKALLPLLALAALAACRTPKAASPDYDATRQRSQQSHQELDQQRAP